MNEFHPPAQADLTQLRREIDAVDAEILAALLRRFDLGRQVADAKASMPPAPNMRPAREAEILRRLAGLWRGPAPVETMAAIWRQIISTVLSLQGPFTIHLATDNPEHARTLAANHFSSGARFVAHDAFEQALGAAEGDMHSIAILALPDGHPPSPWWTHIADGRLRIVARLPFLEPSAVSAYVTARQEPQASGDDISALLLSGGGRPWREVEQAALELGQALRLVAQDGDRYFAEADGFWDGQLPAFDQLKARLQRSGMDMRPLGAYARPLHVRNGQIRTRS
jgi:chorismate mutase